MVAVLLLRMILDHGTVDACAGGVTLRLSRVLRWALRRDRGRVARVCVTGRTPTGPQVVAVLRDGRRSTRTPTASERVMMLALARCTWAECEWPAQIAARVASTRDETPPPFTPGRHVPAKGAQSCISCTCSLVCVVYTRCITQLIIHELPVAGIIACSSRSTSSQPAAKDVRSGMAFTSRSCTS